MKTENLIPLDPDYLSQHCDDDGRVVDFDLRVFHKTQDGFAAKVPLHFCEDDKMVLGIDGWMDLKYLYRKADAPPIPVPDWWNDLIQEIDAGLCDPVLLEGDELCVKSQNIMANEVKRVLEDFKFDNFDESACVRVEREEKRSKTQLVDDIHGLAIEVEELKDLIRHCWVHSGYANCGRKKMDDEKRALYDKVIQDGISEIEREENEFEDLKEIQRVAQDQTGAKPLEDFVNDGFLPNPGKMPCDGEMEVWYQTKGMTSRGETLDEPCRANALEWSLDYGNSTITHWKPAGKEWVLHDGEDTQPIHDCKCDFIDLHSGFHENVHADNPVWEKVVWYRLMEEPDPPQETGKQLVESVKKFRDDLKSGNLDDYKVTTVKRPQETESEPKREPLEVWIPVHSDFGFRKDALFFENITDCCTNAPDCSPRLFREVIPPEVKELPDTKANESKLKAIEHLVKGVWTE